MLGNKKKKTGRIKFSKVELVKSLRIFRFIKPYRTSYILGLLFLILSSIASLIFPLFVGEMVDASKDSLESINRTALYLFGLFSLQAIFSYFRIILFVNVTEKFLAKLRQATYENLIRLPMTFFNSHRIGELNSRIASDISLLQETFTTTSAEFLRQIIIVVGGIILLGFTSINLSFFMLSIFPLIIVVAVIIGRKLRAYSKTVQQNIAESNTIVEETLQGISNVKAFTNEIFESLRYKKKTEEVVFYAIKGGKLRAIFASFIILGIFGAIASVIWYGARLIHQGEMSIGDLTSFLMLTIFIGASIGSIADLYAQIQKAIGATEKLMEILDEESEDHSEGDIKEILKGKIEFCELSFHYPNRLDSEVLTEISFQANPGEQIALVGPSGAGKSTVTQLMMRFYQEYSGRLLIDDMEITTLRLTDLRKQIAIVPQDILLFGGSILENIAYGKPTATKEEIKHAAKLANADGFIEEFPEGYDTLVGDRGIQLSGGQRQRVAIARAVLKNPKILILDEATSALDSESENLVQEALEKLMIGRTSLIIAHRLSTVRKADKIIVLDKGHIVESGTHDELNLIEDGLYKKLSKMQFNS
ncbi:MAG: multidrug ABC transporter ATP-binding protein [Flavobacteriales bacterium]|nr:multidrug ABC transporter ATP-binding protein [Flavobacteriales bacterium]|tara:strand:- start:7343 stop:9115 length:1773 start_codon:yes stop_codon:yes gene_type:complete